MMIHSFKNNETKDVLNNDEKAPHIARRFCYSFSLYERDIPLT